MAGIIILVSFFAEASFAKRVVTKHVQLQSQTVASGLEFNPGGLHRVAAPRMQVDPSPLFNPDSIVLRPSSSPSASIPEDGDYRPDLPTDWKSTGGISSGPPEIVNYVRPPQKARSDWPEGKGKCHRFIKEGDDTYEPYLYNSVIGYVDNTPGFFQGQRRDGSFKGSFRALFNVPGEVEVDDPKLLRTMELLKSYEKDNPSFAAVEVPLPFDMSVTEKATENGARIVVTKVMSRSFLAEFTDLGKRLSTDPEDWDDDKRGNANIARIKAGDIIRAVSTSGPDPKMGAKSGGFWSMMKGQAPVPEDGMAILDGVSVSQYEAALQESVDRDGKNAKVVLLIERPVAIPPPRDKDDWWDGLKFPAPTQLSQVLIPIPIPVDRDPDPRYPPFPKAGKGPMGPQGYPNDMVQIPESDGGVANMFRMSDDSDQGSPSLDPVERAEEEKKQLTKKEYDLNVAKAYDILKHDIEHILQFDDDPRRVFAMDWCIYTEDLETDFTSAVNPVTLNLLRSVAPSFRMSRKGKEQNKKALEELRGFISPLIEREWMKVNTGESLDPITGEQVIKSRWTNHLTVKSMHVPLWLRPFSGGAEWTETLVIPINGISRFYFNAEGKIYRHSIDLFDILLDQSSLNVPEYNVLAQMMGGRQVAGPMSNTG